MEIETLIYPNAESFAQAAATRFIEIANAALRQTGRFDVCLSGGNTPRHMNQLLAAAPLSGRIDWSRVFVFWGDERCVPPDDEESNYHTAKVTLLDQAPIPAENVHRIQGERTPLEAAADYEDQLGAHFGVETPRFDLVLLGMGDDGHTASLFPGTPGIHEQKRWALPVKHTVPPLPLIDRVTLTPPVLNNAANILFLVTGAGKARRLYEVLHGAYAPDHQPSQIIQPVNGQLTWLLDEAAAQLLPK